MSPLSQLYRRAFFSSLNSGVLELNTINMETSVLSSEQNSKKLFRFTARPGPCARFVADNILGIDKFVNVKR